ncbi:hypothetical protein GCM10010297_50180 [Streptomyces malachitofuscus]|nr:hypothetical protein GCM10010297_50180 [Streptomyces malachitofuscus]
MTAPLSYTHGTSATPLLGDTIGANLDRAIAAWPGREALVDVPSGRRWTYAEFGAAVDEVARGLLAKGIATGDRVGIWAVNCPWGYLPRLQGSGGGSSCSTPPPASAPSW